MDSWDISAALATTDDDDDDEGTFDTPEAKQQSQIAMLLFQRTTVGDKAQHRAGSLSLIQPLSLSLFRSLSLSHTLSLLSTGMCMLWTVSPQEEAVDV